jgi:hypothetical protein
MSELDPQRVVWQMGEDPDGNPVAFCTRNGYRFTVRPCPQEENKWKPDVDPALVQAFISIRSMGSMEEAMQFCERFHVDGRKEVH